MVVFVPGTVKQGQVSVKKKNNQTHISVISDSWGMLKTT